MTWQRLALFIFNDLSNPAIHFHKKIYLVLVSLLTVSIFPTLPASRKKTVQSFNSVTSDTMRAQLAEILAFFLHLFPHKENYFKSSLLHWIAIKSNTAQQFGLGKDSEQCKCWGWYDDDDDDNDIMLLWWWCWWWWWGWWWWWWSDGDECSFPIRGQGRRAGGEEEACIAIKYSRLQKYRHGKHLRLYKHWQHYGLLKIFGNIYTCLKKEKLLSKTTNLRHGGNDKHWKSFQKPSAIKRKKTIKYDKKISEIEAMIW